MSTPAPSITETILNSIGNWIANIMAKVSQYLWDNFAPVFNKIATWIDNVYGRLTKLLDSLNTFISEVYNDIVSKITSFVNDAMAFIRDVYDRVANSIASMFDTVTSYIADSFNAVVEQIIGIADRIKTWVVDAFDTLTNGIKSIVENVTTWLRELFNDITSAVNSLLDRGIQVVQAISSGIKDFIDNVINTVGVALRELMEAASKIPQALTDLGTGFAASVENFIGQPLNDIPNAIWTQLGDVMADAFPDFDKSAQQLKDIVTFKGQSASKSRAEWDEFFTQTLPKGGAGGALFNFGIGLFMMLRIGGGIADANAQIVLQEFGEEFPYNIPAVADAIKLKHFNIISAGDAVTIIKKQGFSQDDANKLIKIGEQLPPEGEALSWWLRGIYDDEDINTTLSKHGYNTKDADALKQAAQIIPPVQDLITMAVREVFTPAVAERFGQFEDFPPDFEKWAKKTGLTSDWAKNYWAAHWILPSPQMGFEMLHRRVIDVDDLNLLLKSADVMPFWRQKIVDISYSPYTRIDIRRMHKVGVLTEAEVYDAYQDIGYDVDRATKLTDFTLELNKEKATDDDTELKKLTRSNIIGFYEDGLLQRAEAFGMLRDIGLSDEAATLYLTSTDLTEERRERKQETALILDQAKAGLITFEQGQDALARLGLETRELSKALTKLIRQDAQRTKLPSKGDLDKMLLSDIITESQYRGTLKLIGYSDQWTDALHQLLTG